MISVVIGAMTMAADSTAESSGVGKTRAALIAAFHTNLDYCRKWSAAGDFKSLDRTTGQLPILTAAIARYTPEQNQRHGRSGDLDMVGALNSLTKELSAVAKKEDAVDTNRLLGILDEGIDMVGRTPVVDGPSAIEKNAAGFGPLM